MGSSALDDARGVIDCAIADRVFPAATMEVGHSGGKLWRHASGTLSFDETVPATTIDTPFDLASLTKPVATTTVLMELVRVKSVRLDDPVRLFFNDWRGLDREAVTIGDLLEHASGLPARLLDAPPASRREFEQEICAMALEYPPRSRSMYSDLGFILLGFLAEDRSGTSLATAFERLMVRLTDERGAVAPFPDQLTFALLPGARRHAAPTRPLEDDPRRGRLLVGEVHDNYAAALGGIAGHSGLFGTVSAAGDFARIVLRTARGDRRLPPPFSPEMVALFTTGSTVPGSSRLLGWDAMRPTSSCGTRMSAAAFGHVGFTGTSLWIDPVRDRYFVLLTNRACGGGSLDQMRTVRRAFHDALAEI